MEIYIASSWKNQHAVEMLTAMLRTRGHEVRSFVENNHGEGHGAEKPMDFEEWVQTEQADRSFDYDTRGATECDLVIYVGPSGTDAWAEVGAAWGLGQDIFGLWAKGEPAGIMRKMVNWFFGYNELLSAVDDLLEEVYIANRKTPNNPIHEDGEQQCNCVNGKSTTTNGCPTHGVTY